MIREKKMRKEKCGVRLTFEPVTKKTHSFPINKRGLTLLIIFEI